MESVNESSYHAVVASWPPPQYDRPSVERSLSAKSPQPARDAPGELIGATKENAFKFSKSAQFRWNRPAQPIIAETQRFQVGEIAQFGRNYPAQLVAGKIEALQVGEIA